MKTILKLHQNGNFETLGTALIQSDIPGNYAFKENSITVPKIIEYPPPNYRNYFIEKTSVSGWISRWTSNGIAPGIVHPPDEDDRTSDFIDVLGWGSTTIRIRYKSMNNQYQAWACVIFYGSTKEFLRGYFDDYVGPNPSVGDYTFEVNIPTDAAFLRVATNYYDAPGVDVKISVEKGNTTNTKHYLAPEDMPDWVRDTGHPISIFPQGIVIKGEITQS